MKPNNQENYDDLLVVADVREWRAWLDAHEGASDGVWLLLGKKGKVAPTSLSYAEALDDALCSGWIDGQSKRQDEATFRQRFTPRRARSMWSQRNVEHIARLIDEGRMRSRGLEEVEKAKADGRWERAYAGPATAVVPTDLARIFEEDPALGDCFKALSGQDRYAILHRLMTAPNESTRARRLTRALETLTKPPES